MVPVCEKVILFKVSFFSQEDFVGRGDVKKCKKRKVTHFLLGRGGWGRGVLLFSIVLLGHCMLQPGGRSLRLWGSA